MELTKYPTEKFENKTIVVKKEALYNQNQLLISKHHSKYLDKVILSNGMIIDRIEKVAQDIVKDYYDKTVYFLVIMKGAVVYASHLAEKINDILKNDITDSYKMEFFFEYLSVSSYEDDKSTGIVKIRGDEAIMNKLKNQHVVIVDDIFDSGKSIDELLKYIKFFEPLTLKSTVLFQKMNIKHFKYDIEIDYLGFLIPNEFVIGFGMDYNEQFRQLNHLCTINQFGIDTFKIDKK
jgi:hypoxanthine phosphoribosyltransferase